MCWGEDLVWFVEGVNRQQFHKNVKNSKVSLLLGKKVVILHLKCRCGVAGIALCNGAAAKRRLICHE
jgi:hypothetical protein